MEQNKQQLIEKTMAIITDNINTHNRSKMLKINDNPFPAAHGSLDGSIKGERKKSERKYIQTSDN
jgi:hypothetical protein